MKQNLYFIASSELVLEKPLDYVVREAIAGGVDIVQLRDKRLPAAEVYRLALKLKDITESKNVRLIINDRVDIALAVDADGIHLGQSSLPLPVVRRLVGHGMTIGVSTHGMEEAKRAEKEGADYVTFSPIFPTHCKPGQAPQGIDALLSIKQALGIPVVALGGINEQNISQVVHGGITNVAVMSLLMHAPAPKGTASVLKKKITGTDKD